MRNSMRGPRFSAAAAGRTGWLLLTGLALGVASAVYAGPPTVEERPGAPRYEFREDHDPNGIGKFYMGREIAHVMGVGGVPWLERPEREDEEAPSKLIKTLKLKPGDVVADVGAGSGVLTFMLAEAVGPKGTVYAVDVQEEMLELIANKIEASGVDQVKTVLSTNKTTRLPRGEIDLAIMVDVYHEFEFPYEMMLDLTGSIKPGGRVVFVEYRKEDRKVPIKEVHKMSQAQVKKEMALPELKLKFKETIPTLPRQHIIIFERLPDEEPPAGK